MSSELRQRVRSSGGGQVVINVSAAAYRGLPLTAPYSAPKAASLHLAEALQPEARAWGIELRVINPGFVRSSLTAKNPLHVTVRRVDRRNFTSSPPQIRT